MNFEATTLSPQSGRSCILILLVVQECLSSGGGSANPDCSRTRRLNPARGVPA